MTVPKDLELGELIEDCWVALRAEEIAGKKFDSKKEPEKNWQAFENAHIDVSFEWLSFYSGRRYGEVEADDLLDKAISLAKSQSEWEHSQVEFFLVKNPDGRTKKA